MELFAVSGLRAVHNSRLLAEDVRAVTEDLEARFGDSPRSSRDLLRLVAGEPAVTAELFARRTGVSTPTAYRGH